ncbi:hypothetical protein L2E82_11424 [Cichorium intybus]|uniref:Uncharacterized protein n=1 Tax=Cichorium intybus TaxID=13427 RepID=A0ACB9GDA3_CICIN|nr:hypothetical protein L2E82_11424 [Cichorium intybus]
MFPFSSFGFQQDCYFIMVVSSIGLYLVRYTTKSPQVREAWTNQEVYGFPTVESGIVHYIACHDGSFLMKCLCDVASIVSAEQLEDICQKYNWFPKERSIYRGLVVYYNDKFESPVTKHVLKEKGIDIREVSITKSCLFVVSQTMIDQVEILIKAARRAEHMTVGYMSSLLLEEKAMLKELETGIKQAMEDYGVLNLKLKVAKYRLCQIRKSRLEDNDTLMGIKQKNLGTGLCDEDTDASD